MTPPYDHAPPGSPPSGEPDSAKAPALKASGSQNRKRNRRWQIALDEQEEAAALERAANAELSKMAYGRALLLGSPGPRAKRKPHVHKQLMSDSLADLNRSANVLNQFLPFLHAGRAITLGRECSEALAANRRAADAILEALGRKEPDDDNQGKPAR
jgi:hypothetical protein